MEIKPLSHKTLLSEIGEIEGITLESVDGHALSVILHLRGNNIEIIRDSAEFIDNHVTRLGIATKIRPYYPKNND